MTQAPQAPAGTMDQRGEHVRDVNQQVRGMASTELVGNRSCRMAYASDSDGELLPRRRHVGVLGVGMSDTVSAPPLSRAHRR
jgi:hypothetical protein